MRVKKETVANKRTQAVNIAVEDRHLIQLPQSRDMSEVFKFNRKADEFDVDFEYGDLASRLLFV